MPVIEGKGPSFLDGPDRGKVLLTFGKKHQKKSKESMNNEHTDAKQEQSTLPLHICPGMVALGYFIVSDRNGGNARSFETYEEALEFMAKVNGTDVETEQREVAKHAEGLAEHRQNLINQGKPYRRSKAIDRSCRKHG